MKKKFWKKALILLIFFSLAFGNREQEAKETPQTEKPQSENTAEQVIEEQIKEPATTKEATTEEATTNEAKEETEQGQKEEVSVAEKNASFDGYKIIEVDGGDLSGYREPNAAVDIGFGDREYWAFTNEYGQLVRVIAKEIILQDEYNEPVTDGRYYEDEAKVPGTESDTLDEGHVIADSLGGVSNAYNITPQDSTLNRYGDQAYMEKVIRDAGGCSDFEAIITYPNTETQIPSKYKYTYTLMGNVITDEFENVNPDEYNESNGITEDETTTPINDEVHDISSIDANGNGQVSIKEAKAAGFKMPITKDHWLYQYMTDGDGDGMVGE